MPVLLRYVRSSRIAGVDVTFGGNSESSSSSYICCGFAALALSLLLFAVVVFALLRLPRCLLLSVVTKGGACYL